MCTRLVGVVGQRFVRVEVFVALDRESERAAYATQFCERHVAEVATRGNGRSPGGESKSQIVFCRRRARAGTPEQPDPWAKCPAIG